MCIAILSPRGTEITSQQFRNCWDNNYNGAGFMYNDDKNKLHVVKEMESFDRVYKKYKKLNKKFPNATFVIHFRISTHGVINKSNCHPFKVNNDLGFVHNGVIRAVEKNDKHSDTNVFNREILRQIPQMSVEFMSNPAVDLLFGEFIAHSKLIFMNNFGETAITNAHKGAWEDDGIWYSNESHKKVQTMVDFGGKSMSREEHKRLTAGSQGSESAGTGSVFGGDDRKVGYDYLKDDPTYGYDDDYGRFDGSTMDLHNAETIAELTRRENAKLGKSHATYEGANYVVSDGSVPCQTCGTHSLPGELMSSTHECLECVSQDEAGAIMGAAVSDGALLDNYSGTTIVDERSLPYSEVKHDMIECDNCSSDVEKKHSREFPDWGCTLCHSCIDDFIEADAMDEKFKIEMPDAMEIMFPEG